MPIFNQTYFSYGRDAKSTFLETALFNQDDADTAKAKKIVSTDDPDESGYSRRKDRIKESKKCYFSTNLHCDFMNSVRLIPPGVNLKVILTRNSDKFCILADKTTNQIQYKIKIIDLKLSIRKVRVSQEIMLKHMEQFKVSDALFPFHKAKITTHTIGSGVSQVEINDICTGPLPQQLCIGMVDHEAFTGTQKSNPFVFEPFDCNGFVFKVI